MEKRIEHKHGATWLDQAGIWCSFLCLIHCALMPLVFLFLPALVLGGDYTHIVMAIILPVIALAAFVPSYRRHRDWTIPALGLGGLVLIALALAAPRPYEIGITMTGSLLLIRAHWRNRRQALSCVHE